jgi:hypothetical protein
MNVLLGPQVHSIYRYTNKHVYRCINMTWLSKDVCCDVTRLYRVRTNECFDIWIYITYSAGIYNCPVSVRLTWKYQCNRTVLGCKKGRIIPVRGRRSPQVCDTSRLSHFQDNRFMFIPRKISGTHCWERLSWLQEHSAVRLEGLGQLESPIEAATFLLSIYTGSMCSHYSVNSVLSNQNPFYCIR